MPYSKRTPPIKMVVTTDLYNVLIETLNRNETNSDEDICESAKRLKIKLLRYSIPFKDDGTDKVEVQFFINEANEMLYHLLINIDNVEATLDYYTVLLKVRESNK